MKVILIIAILLISISHIAEGQGCGFLYKCPGGCDCSWVNKKPAGCCAYRNDGSCCFNKCCGCIYCKG